MTRLTFTTAVFLLLCCTYSWRTGDCRGLNCLYSRLDCAPHQDTSWPGPNEYALYRTFIRNRVPDCKYRDPNANSKFEIIRPIDNLGNPNVRLLYSPGYLLNRRYANSMLVSYNVECPKGRLPYLVYNDLDLRGKECFTRCEDYVNISCATCGSSESCGTVPTDNYYNLEQEHFSVTFRTSRAKNDNGFELSVICFDPINTNKAGCSTFGGKRKRDLEIYRNMWHKHAERIRRQFRTPVPEQREPEFIPFPDRPTISTFPTRPTLPPRPPQILRVDVTLRDVVTYRGSTITVSRGGEMVRRIRNIARLVVRDASGGDHSFTRDAVELRPGGVKETIQLRGPGDLLLISSSATFLRDSQPFALSANEKEVLKALSNELFNLISSSNDLYITDIAELQEDDPIRLDPIRIQPEFPSRLHPRRVAVAPFTSLPRQPVSTSAIRQSVLYENSCNPVVRTASTSTLSIAKRQSPFRVDNIRQSIVPLP